MDRQRDRRSGRRPPLVRRRSWLRPPRALRATRAGWCFIAIIFGVDRLLDMCRTTTNVTGDCMVATIVAHSEGDLLGEADANARATRLAAQTMDENP